MNSEKLLSQYLDTGVTIPPYQYNKLAGNLKKTYLRKRYMVATTTTLTITPWEFSDLSQEKKNILKQLPRYLAYSPKDEQPIIIDNFLNKMNEKSATSDIRNLLYHISDEKKDYVIDKIFDKFGKNLSASLMHNIINYCKKSDDEILKLLYRWLKIKDNYISPSAFTMLCISDKFNRYMHINLLKKVLSYPSKNWDFYTFHDFFYNLSANDIYPFFSKIIAKKSVYSYPFMKAYKLINIPNLQDNILRQYVTRMDSTYKLIDLIKDTQNDKEYKNSEEFDPINLVKIYLSGENKYISLYELSNILNVIPEDQRDEVNSLIKKYAIINENIKRIKELL